MSKQINITKTLKTNRKGEISRQYDIFVDGVQTDRSVSRHNDYTHMWISANGKRISAHTRMDLAVKAEPWGEGSQMVEVRDADATPVEAPVVEAPVVEATDLHEQWRLADRMARKHHRAARAGDTSARALATEHRELAARLAKQIVDAGGEHPRKLRWK